MTFMEVEIPIYRSEYDDLFTAVAAAWRGNRAVKVVSDRHPQSIRTALKNRMLQSDEHRKLWLSVSVEDGGCTIWLSNNEDGF